MKFLKGALCVIGAVAIIVGLAATQCPQLERRH
jgi:hypothetical protein